MKNFRQFLNENLADDFLEDWVLGKIVSSLKQDDELWKDLVDEYPYKGGKIYRGINFTTKEDYEEFLKNVIPNNKYISNRVTSWSTDFNTAKIYAQTRPTYDIDDEDFIKAMKVKSRNKDYMAGYKGLVISVKIDKDIAVDLNDYSKKAENEVILPSGKYKITIEHEAIPYKEKYKEDEFEKIVKDIYDLNNNEKGLLYFILHNIENKDIEYKKKIVNYIIYRMEEFEINVIEIICKKYYNLLTNNSKSKITNFILESNEINSIKYNVIFNESFLSLPSKIKIVTSPLLLISILKYINVDDKLENKFRNILDDISKMLHNVLKTNEIGYSNFSKMLSDEKIEIEIFSTVLVFMCIAKYNPFTDICKDTKLNELFNKVKNTNLTDIDNVISKYIRYFDNVDRTQYISTNELI